MNVKDLFLMAAFEKLAGRNWSIDRLKGDRAQINSKVQEPTPTDQQMINISRLRDLKAKRYFGKSHRDIARNLMAGKTDKDEARMLSGDARFKKALKLHGEYQNEWANQLNEE